MSQEIYDRAVSFLPNDEVFRNLFEPNNKSYTSDEVNRHVCYLADIISGKQISDNNMCNYSSLSALTAAWCNRRDIYDRITVDDTLWLLTGAYKGHIVELDMKKYPHQTLRDMMYYAGAGGNIKLIDCIREVKPELIDISLKGCDDYSGKNQDKIEERIPDKTTLDITVKNNSFWLQFVILVVLAVIVLLK